MGKLVFHFLIVRRFLLRRVVTFGNVQIQLVLLITPGIGVAHHVEYEFCLADLKTTLFKDLRSDFCYARMGLSNLVSKR